jgi:hypothetical protein
MSVEIRCPKCATVLRLEALRPGRSVRCLKCRTKLTPPLSSAVAEDDEFRIAAAAERKLAPVTTDAEVPVEVQAETRANRERHRRAPWTMWILLLTMVPLIAHIVSPTPGFDTQVRATLTAKPELFDTVDPTTSRETLLRLVPSGRLLGAHLPYRTWRHWLYGLVSAAGFVGVILLLFRARLQQLSQLLVAVAFTSCAGLLFLHLIHWMASLADESWSGVGNVFWIFFYLVKFAAYSYRGVLDSDVGLFSAWFGFTVGVGLCEEVLKIAPVYAALKTRDDMDWHAALLWGLASGVGMGVAEAIVYAGDFDNGSAETQMYLVRFIASVALQAVWGGAGGMLLWAAQGVFDESLAMYEWVFQVGRILLLPIVLHGLFDTLLRRGLPGMAMLAALASFVGLFALVHYTSRQDTAG